MIATHLQLRVGRCTRDGIITEYLIDLRGGYTAAVTRSADGWRLVVRGRIEQDFGVFDTTAAVFAKVEEYDMLADARRSVFSNASRSPSDELRARLVPSADA